MVRTRSQNSQLDDEQAVQEPTPRALIPARPVQIHFTDPSASGDSVHQDPIIGVRSDVGEQLCARPPSPTQSTRSQRSTASKAARIKAAELKASERLSAIRMRQLQIEADLVQKELEADLATIQDDEQGSIQGPEEAINANLHMEDWMRHAERTQREPTYDRLPAQGTRTIDAATSAREPTYGRLPAQVTQTINAATPARGPTYGRLPARDARTLYTATPAMHLPVTNKTEPRPERGYEDPRARSPTPNRSRNRSIEALVDSFERMSRYRPPPRSSTELPTFDGSENDWMPFKASMRDSTRLHKFSPIENMQRLRNALKGEARNAVASLLYTACDPTEIMEALEQSFGRPEALIDKALEAIKQLPRLGSTTTELNVFAVKVRNIVATITNVEGLDGCLQNRMLTRDIVDKLPPDLRRSFAKYASENRRTGEPHVVILSRFLNNEATIGLEFTYSKPATPATSSWQKPNTKSSGGFDRTRKERGASVFTVIESEQCQYCGVDHKPPQCKKTNEMTVNARWEWAKTNKLCFKCLSKNHRRAVCKAKRCGIDGCIHSHHFLLHQRDSESVTSSRNAQEQSVEVVATTATDMDTNYQVMLKVCPIVVSNSDGIEIQTYALLDEGSTVTLIEDDLADQLNLAGPAYALNIHGANSSQRDGTSRVVRLKLRGKNSKASHIVRARTIRDIQLLNQTISTQLLQYPHLQNLEPSSVCYEQVRPRVLVGSDNWELIVSKQLLIGRRDEPAASRTELGWVIHGRAPHATLSCGEEHVLHIRTGNQNSHRVLTTIPTEHRTPAPTHLGIKHRCQEKTLGLLWLRAEDTLSFNTTMNGFPKQAYKQNHAPNKRQALSAGMSIFYLLGLLSYFTISAKIHLQNLWRLPIGWDEPVPTEMTEDISAWLKNLLVKSTSNYPPLLYEGSEFVGTARTLRCRASDRRVQRRRTRPSHQLGRELCAKLTEQNGINISTRTGTNELADRRTWRAVQVLADSLWRCWVHEYLPTLVPRGQPTLTQRHLQEGDLVEIVDPTLSRKVWHCGINETEHKEPEPALNGLFHWPTRKLAVLTEVKVGATRELR